MIFSDRLSAFFPNNAVTRAEWLFQERTARKPRFMRRMSARIMVVLALGVGLVQVLGLFVAAFTVRDPSPLSKALAPLPTLLVIFGIYYHLYLMFQTISLTANSIAREKESQTWEMLVLTGIDARQIVRGKWWATVQRQYPRYLLLGFIRVGAVAAIVLGSIAAYYSSTASSYYDIRMQSPDPLTIVISGLLSIIFTMANLGLSAACGVMGSAVSKRSALAILRSFANQIVITLVPVLVVAYLTLRANTLHTPPILRSILDTIAFGTVSVTDNGFTLLTSSLSASNYYYATSTGVSSVATFRLEWIITALVTLAWYGLLIWFALWRAEKRAIGALASPPA